MENYLDLKNATDYSKLKVAGEIIKNGGLVLFPTETVYGLGANGLDENAVKKIYKAKGREQDNPLILHVSNFDMVSKIAKNISDIEYTLMKTFWPGPFTIILDRTEIVPDIVTAGLDTVGVRMPSGIIANKLISYADVPIAAPSANISGRPSGTNISDIFEELSDKVDYIVDGGECEVGLESTVVRVVDGIPNILRPGKISPEDIQKAVGIVKIDEHILKEAVCMAAERELDNFDTEMQNKYHTFTPQFEEKMQRLLQENTHIFGNDKAASSEEALKVWEKNKAVEKGTVTVSDSMKKVAKSLPSLTRASKVQKRCLKSGLNFELIEDDCSFEDITEALKTASQEDKEKLLGKLLFKAASVSRECGIDPEVALNGEVERFVSRFEKAEKENEV